MNIDGLLAADATVRSHPDLAHTTNLLVSYHGEIVFERYYRDSGPNDLHSTHSVTKSFTSTLIGILVGDRRMTIVGNRFRDEPDHPGLAPAIRIPNDPELTQAEREGRSPFEACPDSPAVQAISRLADLLLAQSGAV